MNKKGLCLSLLSLVMAFVLSGSALASPAERKYVISDLVEMVEAISTFDVSGNDITSRASKISVQVSGRPSDFGFSFYNENGKLIPGGDVTVTVSAGGMDEGSMLLMSSVPTFSIAVGYATYQGSMVSAIVPHGYGGTTYPNCRVNLSYTGTDGGKHTYRGSHPVYH